MYYVRGIPRYIWFSTRLNRQLLARVLVRVPVLVRVLMLVPVRVLVRVRQRKRRCRW